MPHKEKIITIEIKKFICVTFSFIISEVIEIVNI